MNNTVLDFTDGKNELLKRRISKMKNNEKDNLLLTGTIQEKIVLASMEYRLDVLAKDPNPEVRREVVKYSADLRPFCNDPSSIVRHAAVLQLKDILDCTVPEVKLDRNGIPYVVDNLERQMMSEMTRDLSTAVSTVAKQTLDNLKQRELKEAVSVVLSKSGLEDVSCAVAKDLERSLQERFYSNDIEELPVRSDGCSGRKVGMDR